MRLKQGDFAAATVYEKDPVLQAQAFAAQGATELHVVDLDGAKDGAARQTEIIKRIAAETALAVQAGGGVRSLADVEALLACGVRRVVIGSLAAQAPQTVQEWIKQFGGERFVLALDVRFKAQGLPMVLARGWQEDSARSLWDVLALYEGKGGCDILCTDVERDGMLIGPNLALYTEIRTRFPSFGFLASGGVGTLGDIRALAKLGAKGAIVGKALYEKRIALAEAIREALHAR